MDCNTPVLGILGGLGPAASSYFYQMVIDHTLARQDQDHIDVVLSGRATTPDRTAYILGQSTQDPFAIMERDAQMLVRYGATVLAMPCNTAHYFFDRLASNLPVPFLHMPLLTVRKAKEHGCKKLGILATTGTLQVQAYQKLCEQEGLEWAIPSPLHQEMLMDVIYGQIKQGRPADRAQFDRVAQDLRGQGCQMAVLGCTELSLIKRDEHLDRFFLDSSEVLCESAILACGKTPIGFCF